MSVLQGIVLQSGDCRRCQKIAKPPQQPAALRSAATDRRAPCRHECAFMGRIALGALGERTAGDTMNAKQNRVQPARKKLGDCGCSQTVDSGSRPTVAAHGAGSISRLRPAPKSAYCRSSQQQGLTSRPRMKVRHRSSICRPERGEKSPTIVAKLRPAGPTAAVGAG